jgi:hypothetical protein
MVGSMMKALVEGGQRRMIGDLCGTLREERICYRGTEGEENGENRMSKDPRASSVRGAPGSNGKS